MLDSQNVASFLFNMLVSSLRFFLNVHLCPSSLPAPPLALIMISLFDYRHHRGQRQWRQDKEN